MAHRESLSIFLSHNSQDKAVVEHIGRLLRAKGFEVWLDKWSLPPGSDWQERLETVIETCQVAAVFLGPKGVGRWQDREIKACLGEFIDRGLKVIPVLLPGRQDPPKLPLFLRDLTWLDYRGGPGDPEALDRFIWGITGQEPAETSGEAPAAPSLPALTILHLSDLQFGRKHRYPKGKGSYNTLSAKLSADLDYLGKEHQVRPNAIVVTGDVAETSMPDEYQQAAEFLEQLGAELEIGKERIVLVPGNHDVNRKLCQGARLMAEAAGGSFEEPYFAKFGNYQQFFNDFHDGLRIFDESNLCHVYRFDEDKALIAGFNSCIRESEKNKDHYGWVGLDQVESVVERCDEIDPKREYLRVAVVHHNFTSGSDRQGFQNKERT